MKSKEVYFEIILPRSAYLNYRLGVTKIVAPGKTDLDAWDEACAYAEAWHKKKHPELYKHNETSLTVEQANTVTEINACTTLELLATYKGFATGVLSKYYMDKMKELTNKKK